MNRRKESTMCQRLVHVVTEGGNRYKYRLLFSIAVSVFLLSTHTAFAAQTYVSLTFDDGRASQVNAGSILEKYGVHGTFYLISGDLGSDPYYMSLDDVYSLAASGNEIGGHTRAHPDLTKIPESAAADEICSDQQQLQSWGFPAVSFAYPFGATNPIVESVVASCKERGYNVTTDYHSARIVGGLQCPGCDVAESLPPQDAFSIRTAGDGPKNSTTLDDLKSMVIQAETTGGWLVIPFHSVCSAPGTAPAPGDASDCGGLYSTSYADLDQFVQWLSERSSSGTTVKTVAEVMQMSSPPPADPVVGPNLVYNPSLELDTNTDGIPDGFLLGGYGANSYSYYRLSTGAHTGTYAEQLTVTSLSSGDRKVTTSQDLSSSTIFASPGESYETSVWYQSDVPILLVAFYHDADGWHYWNESPQAAPSGAWTQLKWRTPPMPQVADYWSYGPALIQSGTMTVDDFSSIMINGNGTPCENTKPALSLNNTSIYWASFTDYLSNDLSVSFDIGNIGATSAYNVRIDDLPASNGVICITSPPLLLGHIPAGGLRSFTAKYRVPPGTSSFRASVSASVEDGCANIYHY